MVKVIFKNVGRNSKTWEAELPDSNTMQLITEARKALISQGVDCYDGKIYAGMRHVGDYEIVEPKPVQAVQAKKPTKKKAKATKKPTKKKAAKK
jgi:hypothetical protein